MLNLFELIGSKCICLRQGRSQWEVSFLLCSHIEGSYVLAEAYYREWPWEHFCLAWRWASCLKRKNKGIELCMILLVVLLQSCLRYGARIPIGGAKYRTIFFFFGENSNSHLVIQLVLTKYHQMKRYNIILAKHISIKLFIKMEFNVFFLNLRNPLWLIRS